MKPCLHSFLFREKPITHVLFVFRGIREHFVVILTFFLNLTHRNLFWFTSELNLSFQA